MILIKVKNTKPECGMITKQESCIRAGTKSEAAWPVVDGKQ